MPESSTGAMEVRPVIRVGLVGVEFEELERDGTTLAREEIEFVVVDPTDLSPLTVRGRTPRLVLVDTRAAADRTPGIVGDLRALGDRSSVALVLIVPGLDRDRWEALGVDGTVTRPLTAARLLDALRHHVPLEEREGERAEQVLKVELRSADGEWTGFTRDIGPTGAFVHGNVPFPEGAELDLHLALPGDEPLRGPCLVVRTERDGEGAVRGAALRFLRFNASDRGRLARWLRDRGRGAA